MVAPRTQVEDTHQPKQTHREDFSGPTAFAMILTALAVALLSIGIVVSGAFVN